MKTSFPRLSHLLKSYWQKKSGILVIGLFLTSLSQAQEVDPVALFDSQIMSSCEAKPSYFKTVTDLNTGDKEDQQSQPAITLEDEKQICELQEELGYAFERYYGSTRLLEYFDVQSLGDSLIAVPLDPAGSTPELKRQKIVMSPDNKVLRYVESYILKDYWLYQTSTLIKVSFDEQGRYLSHRLEIKTEVWMIERSLSALIEGKAQY